MRQSTSAVEKIGRTRGLPKPTYYVNALIGKYSKDAYCEELAPQLKGSWRQKAFGAEVSQPLDLEIGTGNGFFFAHYAAQNPDRLYVGIEKKYKPLIQSIRRALDGGSKNAKMIRYCANHLQDLFAENELNNVFIHFPDPWTKKRWNKNRLIQKEFLDFLYKCQRPGSFVEFKTDNREYFDWAVERFKNSSYEVTGITYDLHNSEFAEENFITHFEKIFLKKNQPIHLIRLQKN